jgi:FixJ family two-component response regulator
MQPHPSPGLNLYIVDDDDDVLDSLGTLFIARRYRVQTFSSGESFLSAADTASAGCVVLDVRMGGISGLQVFEELHRLHSPLLVILLSGHLDVPIAKNYTRKGAFDCLEKPVDENVLIETVHLAMNKSAEVSANLVVKREVWTRWDSLTPREKDVSRQMRKGWANKLIADELTVGVRAVETHRAKVYDKLWVSNPTELDRLMRDHDIQ